MIDVDQRINAVSRRIGSRTLEAGEARTSTISQTYNSSIDDVWDACTNPQRIPRWFLPVSGDLKVNGKYQLEGNAGGTIEECDPPHRFTATWEYGGDVSWIELRLISESAESTRLELDHIAHVDDEKWAEYGPGATGIGWDLAMLGLTAHLESGAAQDPDAWMEWSASDEGTKFITLSSQRWYEANVAAGADEAEARLAADRTTAAYTGES